MMRPIVLLLVFSGIVDAGIFRRGRRVQQVRVVKQQVVQPVAVAPIGYILAAPGFYGAPVYASADFTPDGVARRRLASEQRSRAPAIQSSQESTGDDVTRDILRILQRLDERISALEDNVVPPPPFEVPLLLQNNCAGCHTAPDGKGDFDLVSLFDPAVANKALQMVSAGKMPLDTNNKPAKLEASERKRLVAAIKELIP